MRRSKRIDVDFYFDWTDGVKLSKLKEDIIKLEKLGVTDIEIELYTFYGSDGISIEAFYERLETEQEYEDRIEHEKRLKEGEKIRELAELKRLKEKYENL